MDAASRAVTRSASMVDFVASAKCHPPTRPRVQPVVPTTLGFAPLDDHSRLPSRFYGRFTTTAGAMPARR